jgi:probable rRNA maturation factor
MGIEIQRQLELEGIPDDASLRRYAEAAMANPARSEICIRIVDEAEGRAMNLQWRGKDYATNVLSFPGSVPPGVPAGEVPELMGDIVLCAPVVAREAQAQDKSPTHHWSHLIVHGVLHLQGFDHIEQPSASLMEQREREILAGLDIPDPYRDEDHSAA